jgi:hypothetical protein
MGEGKVSQEICLACGVAELKDGKDLITGRCRECREEGRHSPSKGRHSPSIGMNLRPRSVMIISILLILSGAISLISLLISLQEGPLATSWLDPQKYGVMGQTFYWVLVALISPFVSLLCGMGMLGGSNLARWFYIIYSALVMSLSWITYGRESSLPVQAFVFSIWAIVVYFLVRPDASAFFESK